MRMLRTTYPVISALLASAWLVSYAVSNQAQAQELQNPATAITNEAMVATGACVAKYVGRLDDGNLEPAAVAKQVAARCQHEIIRSVGLVTQMSGRPDDYAKNLAYINAVFTTNAVVRFRAAGSKRQI
jgi:hypothetical protein